MSVRWARSVSSAILGHGRSRLNVELSAVLLDKLDDKHNAERGRRQARAELVTALRVAREDPRQSLKQDDWRVIEAGEFQMGSTNEEGEGDEHPQHPVSISGFRMGRREVTNEDYRHFDPAHDEEAGNELPVVNVTWYEATAYAAWIGSWVADGEATDFEGRLPTEAEWEYACRAGTVGPWSCKESELAGRAWFEDNSDAKVHPVGTKKANPWGLFDMHGNAWEWCSDWYDNKYPTEPKQDPQGPTDGSERVMRGGCYGNTAVRLRSARRGGVGPGGRWVSLGFRVALSPPRAD